MNEKHPKTTHGYAATPVCKNVPQSSNRQPYNPHTLILWTRGAGEWWVRSRGEEGEERGPDAGDTAHILIYVTFKHGPDSILGCIQSGFPDFMSKHAHARRKAARHDNRFTNCRVTRGTEKRSDCQSGTKPVTPFVRPISSQQVTPRSPNQVPAGHAARPIRSQQVKPLDQGNHLIVPFAPCFLHPRFITEHERLQNIHYLFKRTLGCGQMLQLDLAHLPLVPPGYRSEHGNDIMSVSIPQVKTITWLPCLELGPHDTISSIRNDYKIEQCAFNN